MFTLKTRPMSKVMILNKIRDHYGFVKNIDFANFLGISPQTLSNWYARDTFDAELLYTKCEDINTQFIVAGDGPMLRDDLPPATHVNQNSGAGIPLIPISAFAGVANGDVSVFQFECDRYIIPVFKEAEFLISVKGSSMTPKFSSGDIIACKKLALKDIFFQWNKVYVIDTEQGVLVKRIHRASDPEYIKIVSENTKYEPFELHLSQIRAVAIVIGVVRLE